jgi:hypothetical protein
VICEKPAVIRDPIGRFAIDQLGGRRMIGDPTSLIVNPPRAPAGVDHRS